VAGLGDPAALDGDMLRRANRIAMLGAMRGAIRCGVPRWRSHQACSTAALQASPARVTAPSMDVLAVCPS
jgi:hypothetical protein